MEQERTYLIYNYRIRSILIFILVSLIIPMAFLFSSRLKSTPNMIVFMVISISGYFLARLGLQPIRIILTDEKIRLEYLSYNLKRVIKAKEALLENISEFSDHSGTSDDRLTLYFKNHMTFQLHKHTHFQRNDDFEQLIFDFKRKSGSIIKPGDAVKSKFPKYWDYYKSSEARFWFIVSILVLPIIVLIALLTKEVLILIMGLFPIFYIINYRGSNK